MSSEAMVHKLRDVLREVMASSGEKFSGTGVLVCDCPDALPIYPLRLTNAPEGGGGLSNALAALSVVGGEYHDGFHIVSSEWQITLTAQYFSPPIVPHSSIDRTKRIGGRYLAAMFGSALPAVRLSGIASHGFGIAIFESGTERLHEKYS